MGIVLELRYHYIVVLVSLCLYIRSYFEDGYCCRFGSDQLKREYLAPVISGEMVSCIGVSELSGGSDVASKFIVTRLFKFVLLRIK